MQRPDPELSEFTKDKCCSESFGPECFLTSQLCNTFQPLFYWKEFLHKDQGLKHCEDLGTFVTFLMISKTLKEDSTLFLSTTKRTEQGRMHSTLGRRTSGMGSFFCERKHLKLAWFWRIGLKMISQQLIRTVLKKKRENLRRKSWGCL